jgi:hypothetical protein
VRTVEIERLPVWIGYRRASETSFVCAKMRAKKGSKMSASRLLLASQFAAHRVPKVDHVKCRSTWQAMG